MRTTNHRRPRRLLVAATALLLIGSACSDGDSGAAGTDDSPSDDAAVTTTQAPTTTTQAPTTTTTQAPTTTRAPTTTTEPPAPEPVAVTALDYGYAGLPESVEAGTSFTLENASDTELHEMVAIRLPDDETRSVQELLQLPPEELAAFFPLVETVIIAPPGAEGFPVEGTGTLTEEGRYLVICAIPTGADPDEYLAAAAESDGGPPDVPGGPPHFVNGMFAEIRVEG